MSAQSEFPSAEIKKILDSHKTWLESDGKQGQQANFVGKTLGRVNLANANLTSANLVDANLVGANLAGANLSNANLKDVDLAFANLRGTNFDRSSFIGANLSEASLINATLEEAILVAADLDDADLKGANFRRAILNNANLSGVNLRGANLADADLRFAKFPFTYFSKVALTNARFDRAMLYETSFADMDLSSAIGLDKCEIAGPCFIDYNTLLKSKNLPESFLRGCGLPDSFIEYLPSLLNKPIQFYSCFISYSHKDESFAQRIYADLQSAGVRCWFAPEDLKTGDRTRRTIDEAIRVHDKLLIVLSERSVESDWVEHEVETALAREGKEKKTMLFPVRIDDAVMDSETGWASHIKNTRHIGDFRKWKEHDSYQKAFERLLRDLKKALLEK